MAMRAKRAFAPRETGATREPVTFRLDRGLLERLRAAAKAHGYTMTSIVEAGAWRYLEEMENGH